VADGSLRRSPEPQLPSRNRPLHSPARSSPRNWDRRDPERARSPRSCRGALASREDCWESAPSTLSCAAAPRFLLPHLSARLYAGESDRRALPSGGSPKTRPVQLAVVPVRAEPSRRTLQRAGATESGPAREGVRQENASIFSTIVRGRGKFSGASTLVRCCPYRLTARRTHTTARPTSPFGGSCPG
jgi:hypothetical protein